MAKWYDPDGNPVDMLAGASRLSGDGFHVADHYVGPFRISTVFLGLNHNHYGGPPLIYETMVFRPPDWGELDMDRYATFDEALAGHRKMLRKWRRKRLWRRVYGHYARSTSELVMPYR